MKTLKIYLFLLTFSLSLHAQNERVGIGTTTPQAKLHIAGDLQVEDLAGNGERTLVATPEGKIKATTNTTPPNSSNTDTLRAKFIELVNDEGSTKFIINAHTGQFQMMDEDTVRYELEVNSPIKVTKRFENGEEEVSSEQSDINIIVGETLGHLFMTSLANEENAISLLENGIVSRVNIEVTDRKKEFFGLSEEITEESSNTFFITNPNGETVVLTLDQKRTEGFLSGISIEFSSIKIKGPKPSSSQTTTEDTNEGTAKTTEDTNAKSTTTTVSNEEGESRSQSSEGIDDEFNPIENLTDFFGFLNNQKTADESTLSNTETGDNVSLQIDEDSGSNVQFTDGGSTVIINEKEIEQTDSEGTPRSANINQILEDVTNFPSLLQEQENQGITTNANILNVATESTEDESQDEEIAQNEEDFDEEESIDEDQDDEITANTEALEEEENIEATQDVQAEEDKAQLEGLKDDLENASNNQGSENTSIIALDGNDFANLKPTNLIFKPVSEDGSKGEFSKDEIKFVDSNGDTFLINCETIKKSKQNKAMGLIAMDLNLDEETLEIVGDLDVLGSITEIGKKIIQIDHPNDPSNQSLQYSPIGTNELLNIYSGNTTTNEEGIATIQLPTYLQSLNTQFRYQLTVIGSFAQAQIAKEINDHQFTIHSSEPNVEVSWQITGVRNDAYAQENPLEVVVNKKGAEKGTVLYDATTKAFTPVLNRKTTFQQVVETADVE